VSNPFLMLFVGFMLLFIRKVCIACCQVGTLLCKRNGLCELSEPRTPPPGYYPARATLLALDAADNTYPREVQTISKASSASAEADYCISRVLQS
jgi:hypothetical protein